MSRRVSFIVFLGLIGLTVFTTGISAGAAPQGSTQDKQVEMAVAQDRLREIRTEASSSYEAYNNALFELNQLDGKIDSTSEELAAAEDRLAQARADLEEQASQVYKSGNVAFVDVLVGVDDFSEFSSRVDLWLRLLGEERDQFDAVSEARAELQAQQAALETQRDERAATLESAVEDKTSAEDAKAEAEAYLNDLDNELAAMIQAEEERQAQEALEAALAARSVEEAAVPETAEQSAPVQSRFVASEEPVEESEVPAEPKVQDVPVEEPVVETVRVSDTSAQADLAAEQEAKAAERAEARAAAEVAAEEAELQAELAAQEAADQEAADQAAAEQRAAEREAAAEEARAAAEQAAVEEAAAQQAAQQAAAEQLAAQRAEERREAAAAEQAAAEQAAAEEAAAEEAAAEEAAQQQAAAEQAAISEDAAEPAPAPAADSGSSEGGSGSVSASGSAAVAEAETWLGTPYLWGGTSRSGVDCSGLTMMVYAELGVSLPRTTGEQFGVGTPVSTPAPGDLVFFGGGGNIASVGIVTGPDTAIKATVPGDTVRYVSISEVANATGGLAGYRRVI